MESTSGILPLVALAPPLGIAYLIYRSDRWERERQKPLLVCLGLGVVISLLGIWIENIVSQPLLPVQGLVRELAYSLLCVALIEESLKLLALWVYPYRQPFFNEGMDGIVYAVMIGMGLAAVENFWYALHYGWSTTLWRSLTAVPAHAVFAIFQGYYAGRAHFEPGRERALLGQALLWSVMLHGIYNFLFIQQAYKWLLLLAAPLMGLTVWMARDFISRQQRNSPFRP